MRNALLAVAVVALAFNAYTMNALRQTPPPPTVPPWVEDICGRPTDNCTLPNEVFSGSQVAQRFLTENDVPCEPDACGPNPRVQLWIALSRGDVPWMPGATSKEIFAARFGLYSPPNWYGTEFFSGQPNNGELHLGGVVTFTLPVPAFQAPEFPAPDSASTQGWFELAYPECVANGICPAAVSMTPAEFQTMLDASSYGVFADPLTGHNHNRPDLNLTRAQSLDGVTVTLPPTGPPG